MHEKGNRFYLSICSKKKERNRFLNCYFFGGGGWFLLSMLRKSQYVVFPMRPLPTRNFVTMESVDGVSVKSNSLLVVPRYFMSSIYSPMKLKLDSDRNKVENMSLKIGMQNELAECLLFVVVVY